MARWIALFRGINVGGNNILPMQKLKNDLAALKFKNVRTYIQSGNVVFDADEENATALVQKIRKRIERQHGFSPQVFLLRPDELSNAIAANPFPAATADPKSLHFFFLQEPPAKPNLAALDQAKTSTEQYSLTEQIFFLYAPDGVGRSKLAATAEKHLGVAVTARNYRTVEKLAAFCAQS